MSNDQANRRDFLRTGLAAGMAGATAVAPVLKARAALTKSANGRIGIGFIGTGGRAQTHLDIVGKFK